MFDDSMFEKWLDNKTNDIVYKMGKGEKIESEEMMVLVLKAQSNHFHHLDKELREDTKDLREDMSNLNKDLRKDMNKLNIELKGEMNTLREDMDKRFEQVDKKFDAVIFRMDRFMFWSLGLTLSSTIFIIGFLKFF